MRAILCVLVTLIWIGFAGHLIEGQIAGCGGFVKPTASLASSVNSEVVAEGLGQLQVELYTADGLLKDTTQCSPNGYFFMPLYDGGSYSVRVAAPSGWSFSPSSGPCSVGAPDLQLSLTGFFLAGLLSLPPSCPPAPLSGASLTLSHPQSGFVAHATSEADGSFRFEGVASAAGSYALRMGHPSGEWAFEKDEVDVTMGWGNLQLSQPLRISGFAASGRVLAGPSGNAGAEGVMVSLLPVQEGNEGNSKTAVSDASGEFRFENLPCGEYIVVTVVNALQDEPVVTIHPPSLRFSVTAGGVRLAEPFRIMGFSISGTVLLPSGLPLEGASVTVAGHYHAGHPAVTAVDGRFTLERMNAGDFVIAAVKEHYTIPDHRVRISLDSKSIPAISATELDICGSLRLPRLPAGVPASRSVQLASQTDPSFSQLAVADTSGDFCFRVQPGLYFVRPLTATAEKQSGLAFEPERLSVALDDAPVLALRFDQVLVSISPAVECFQMPCSSEVSLSVTQLSTGVTLLADPTGPLQLLPGLHRVYVRHAMNAFCWDVDSVEIDLRHDQVPAIAFRQVGHRLVVQAVPSTVPSFALHSSLTSTPLVVQDGHLETCVVEPGVHLLTPRGCLHFDQRSYPWDTSSVQIVRMQLTELQVVGQVAVDASLDAGKITLSVTNLDSRASEIAVEISEEPDGYRYSFWVPPGSGRYHVKALFKQPRLLAYPEGGITVTAPLVAHLRSCPHAAEPMSVREGRFLTGVMDPPIAGVAIDVLETVLVDGDPQVVKISTVHTQADGAYDIGPFYDHQSLKLSASKEGFEFRERDGLFFARRLGSIAVTVRDSEGLPVADVLLSLSGSHSFRNNSQSNAEGFFVFSGLFPGEFYLRPLLKEYSFEPANVALQIREGTQERFEILATRHAFSCFGSLSSLGRSGIGHVQVKAHHPSHSEETRTDHEGRFRLRGLKPGLTYQVSPLLSAHSPVSRALPAFASVTIDAKSPADVNDVHFIGFLPLKTFDIVGTVDTELVHWPELEVFLYERSEEGGEQQLANYSLQQGAPDFFFGNLDRSLSYSVRLQYDANRFFDRVINASSDVFFNKESRSLVTVLLYFSTSLPSSANYQIDHVSLIIFILLCLLGWATLRRKQVKHAFRSGFRSLLSSSSSSSSSSTSPSTPASPKSPIHDSLSALDPAQRAAILRTQSRTLSPKRN